MCLFIWIASTVAFLCLPWRYFHKKVTNRRIPCTLSNAVIMNLLLWPMNVLFLYGVGILLGFEGPEKTVVIQISGINGLFMVLNGFAVGIFCRRSHRSASSKIPLKAATHALHRGDGIQEPTAFKWIRWFTSGAVIIGWLFGVGWFVFGFFVLWYGCMAANAPSLLLWIPLFSILPYVIFFFGIRISRTPGVTICVSVLSGVGIVIGALGQVYMMRGYPFNFVVTSVGQLLLAWPAFGLAWWFMPRVPHPQD